MATIKNILYLDEYKMYSISSQLFGGLTQYLTSLEQRSEDRSEEQSGPPLSGRMMADILSFHTSTEERKFLHDYSYTLFEDALREQGKLLEATNTELRPHHGRFIWSEFRSHPRQSDFQRYASHPINFVSVQHHRPSFHICYVV